VRKLELKNSNPIDLFFPKCLSAFGTFLNICASLTKDFKSDTSLTERKLFMMGIYIQLYNEI
jgi:hypothetical protein